MRKVSRSSCFDEAAGSCRGSRPRDRQQQERHSRGSHRGSGPAPKSNPSRGPSFNEAPSLRRGSPSACGRGSRCPSTRSWLTPRSGHGLAAHVRSWPTSGSCFNEAAASRSGSIQEQEWPNSADQPSTGCATIEPQKSRPPASVRRLLAKGAYCTYRQTLASRRDPAARQASTFRGRPSMRPTPQITQLRDQRLAHLPASTRPRCQPPRITGSGDHDGTTRSSSGAIVSQAGAVTPHCEQRQAFMRFAARSKVPEPPIHDALYVWRAARNDWARPF